MPIYRFQNPNTQEIKDLIQKMDEVHEYIDSDGLKWDRIFFSPLASVDSEIDPFSAKDFASKTGKKRGTVGDLYDQAKEASLKREAKDGKDFVKEKYEQEYSKKRGGRKPYKPISDAQIEI